MSQFTDAADAIRRQTKQLEQMQFAATVLDQIGSLDNGVKEAQAAKAAAEKECEITLAELADAKEDVKKARHTCKQLLEDTSEKAAALMKATEEKAAKLEADAQNAASALGARVAGEIASMKAKASEDAAKAAENIAALEAHKAELEAAVGLVEARLAKAEKQFDVMRDKLAAMVA